MGHWFELSQTQVTLDSGDTVMTDMLSLGGAGIDVFVGVNGGSDEAIGFSTNNLEFAFAIFDEQEGDREWISLQSTIADASFVGVPEFTLSIEDLAVKINRSASDSSLIDFATAMIDIVGRSTQTLDMDASLGELLSMRGRLTIDIAGFATLSGVFAFSRTTPGGVETFTAIGREIDASLRATDGVEVNVTDASFGLVMFSDGVDTDYALYAEGSASITGAAIITLEGDMTVLANTTGLQQVNLGDLGIVDYGTTDDTFVFTGNDITISVASLLD